MARGIRVTHRIQYRHHAAGVPMQERIREVHGAPPANLDATPAPTALPSGSLLQTKHGENPRRFNLCFRRLFERGVSKSQFGRHTSPRVTGGMSSESPPRWPRVGVGVLVVREGKVLIGKRKGSHGAGQYALPGGKLEWKETWADCARREVLEETAIDLSAVPVTYCYVTEAVIDENNHWITVLMVANVDDTVEASNEEPDKCEGWEWMNWDEVPKPRFLPLDNAVSDPAFAPRGVETKKRSQTEPNQQMHASS